MVLPHSVSLTPRFLEAEDVDPAERGRVHNLADLGVERISLVENRDVRGQHDRVLDQAYTNPPRGPGLLGRRVEREAAAQLETAARSSRGRSLRQWQNTAKCT